jgi:hypothetical protein
MLSLDDVYRKFGEVSEAAQYLETELGTLLLQIHGVESDLFLMERREEAAEIYKSINKSTLGYILKKIAEKSRNLNHAADLFAGALAERNRLSHWFWCGKQSSTTFLARLLDAACVRPRRLF